MRNIKLTRQEKNIESALLKGEYIHVNRRELDAIAEAIASRKKDTVLNIRVNSQDLRGIKEKARKLGVRYQSLLSELIHRVAHS